MLSYFTLLLINQIRFINIPQGNLTIFNEMETNQMIKMNEMVLYKIIIIK